jgi:biopolymer transport protein ExbD
MAMGGLDREDFSAPMAEINTTPLVDVMLVLLVIFLVTAPMLTQAVKLKLPNETTTAIADEKPITLSISENGQYFWGEEAISPEQLEQRLQQSAASDKTRPIHLRADVNVPYGNVSKTLVLAQKYGLTNIGFITEPK